MSHCRWALGGAVEEVRMRSKSDRECHTAGGLGEAPCFGRGYGGDGRRGRVLTGARAWDGSRVAPRTAGQGAGCRRGEGGARAPRSQGEYERLSAARRGVRCSRSTEPEVEDGEGLGPVGGETAEERALLVVAAGVGGVTAASLLEPAIHREEGCRARRREQPGSSLNGLQELPLSAAMRRASRGQNGCRLADRMDARALARSAGGRARTRSASWTDVVACGRRPK